MSELQQKKIARDAAIAKAEQEAAAKATAEEAALTKAFTDRAEKYEKEYEQVSNNDTSSWPMVWCVLDFWKVLD